MEWRAEQSRRPRNSLDKVRIGENSSRVDGKKISQKTYFEIFCNDKPLPNVSKKVSFIA